MSLTDMTSVVMLPEDLKRRSEEQAKASVSGVRISASGPPAGQAISALSEKESTLHA